MSDAVIIGLGSIYVYVYIYMGRYLVRKVVLIKKKLGYRRCSIEN